MVKLEGIARRARQLPAQTRGVVVDRDVSRNSRLGQRGQYGVSKTASRRWLDHRSALLLPRYGEDVIIARPGDRDLSVFVRQGAMLDRIRGQLMQGHADTLRGLPAQPSSGPSMAMRVPIESEK